MRRWNSTQLAELKQKQQQQQQQQQHHVQQQRSQQNSLQQQQPSSAFRRMLSLQRTQRPARQTQPPPPPTLADLVPLTPLNPLTPPPLPPRGPRPPRQRNNSEFSTIVLDVKRLFHSRSSSPSSSSSTSKSSSSSVASGEEGDVEQLEEDEDIGRDVPLTEADPTVVFEAASDSSSNNGDTEAHEKEENSSSIAAAAAAAAEMEARQAAVEVEEAEDAYSEIPIHSTGLGKPLSGLRQATQSMHIHCPSSAGQSRAFLETLEIIKTPTIPDSDPESPVYTTDCDEQPRGGGHNYYHYFGHRLRNPSSLLLHSAGEESVYSHATAGPSRVDAVARSPVPPSLTASNLRRISHSSRLSVASGNNGQTTVERKVSRASRAVKLDYEFNTSSGKTSLQKLGSQSLSRLEDLAQIGSMEQGTNYKRSYVSLYKPLHPLFAAMKLFGAFHTRQSGGKTAAKFTHSYIYSGLVMLAMWFNVLRYLFVYDWGQEMFDSLLFLKLTHHVIYIQAAVALTVMFRASGSFPRFFKACHEFMSRRHNLTYRYTLHRRAKITAAVGCGVILLELVVFFIWALQSDGDYFRVFLRPYTYIVPWSDASKGVLGFFYFVFDIYLAAAWVFPALLFCNFTWLFEREFRFLAHRLQLACTNERIFVGDIEKFRLESWKISKLVARFDHLFNFYVFTVFITDILGICLIMYNLIVGSYPGNGIVLEAWFWLLSALIRLFGVTISASRVNQAACSPLNIIQNMNLRDYAVNPAKIGQLMIFLNKLTIGNIGFTAWNLFTLSRTSTMTIAAMIITYTVLFVKLGASYGQDDRLRPRTSAAPVTSTGFQTTSSLADYGNSFGVTASSLPYY